MIYLLRCPLDGVLGQPVFPFKVEFPSPTNKIELKQFMKSLPLHSLIQASSNLHNSNDS